MGMFLQTSEMLTDGMVTENGDIENHEEIQSSFQDGQVSWSHTILNPTDQQLGKIAVVLFVTQLAYGTEFHMSAVSQNTTTIFGVSDKVWQKLACTFSEDG